METGGPADSPSRLAYPCLADSADYLSGFARGVARELGRENDPEAAGKCETFQQSVHALCEALLNIPQEPYFGLASNDLKVGQYTKRLQVANSELSGAERQLLAHQSGNPQDKGSLLRHFLHIRQVLATLADDLLGFGRDFRSMA